MKYQNIRKEIKKLSQTQTELKPQRKTINFKGTRFIESNKASYSVFRNKYRLMHLYLAYSKLKGKEVIYPTKKEYSKSLIDSLVKEFYEEELV